MANCESIKDAHIEEVIPSENSCITVPLPTLLTLPLPGETLKANDNAPFSANTITQGYDSADSQNIQNYFELESLKRQKMYKSGYLMKRGERRKNWKKRWVVLKQESLAYYKNEKEYECLCILDLNSVYAISEVRSVKRQNVICIVTKSRTYYFQCEDYTQMFSWLETLITVRQNLVVDNHRIKMATISSASAANTEKVTTKKISRQVTDPTGLSPKQSPPTTMKSASFALEDLPSNFSSENNQNDKFIKTTLKESKPPDMEICESDGNTPLNGSPILKSSPKERLPSPTKVGVTFADMVDSDSGEGELDETSENSQEEDDEPGPLPTNGTPAQQLHPEQISSRIINEGYLYKRRPKQKAWNRRWFVLTPGRLSAYKDEREYVLHRMIQMSEVLAILEYESKSSQFCFQIVTAKRTFVFRAETEDLALKWIETLNSEHCLFQEEVLGEQSWTLQRGLKKIQQSHFS